MKWLLVAALFTSCASQSSSENMESKVHQYMKDSVVPTFNDPASYQFVSMELDTVTVKELSSRMDKAVASGSTSDFKEQRDMIKPHQNNPDKILYIDADVKCRGKNKFGGLILNEVKLRYNPDAHSFAQR